MQATDRQAAGYEAAQHGAALWRVPEPGYLIIGGRDQQDFIQRQTTNDVRQLEPGRAQLTVLTSPTARILDVWRLAQEPDAIGVITVAGRGAATARYLQGRIFFMDKVTVTDASAEWAQIEVLGPEAGQALAAIGVGGAPERDQIVEAEVEGGRVRAIGTGEAVLLLVAAGAAGAVIERLGQAGAVELRPETVALLRVERGVPGGARELTEDYTPLEMNMQAAISTSKGCYTGQEVIARQINYDKITKRLAGLRLDAAVAAGAAVRADGRTVGEVTSVAESPRLGAIALAVLKRPAFEPGTTVMVGGEGGEVSGTVVALPFE